MLLDTLEADIIWQVNIIKLSFDIQLNPFFFASTPPVDPYHSLQEVKCQRSKITRDMALVPGYDAYFSFSKAKLGYSGVCVYVKSELGVPKASLEGITGILQNRPFDVDFLSTLQTPADALDGEGRCIILEFECLVLINIYFPNFASEARGEFIMDYYGCVQKRIEDYLAKGQQVVLVGDVNAVHDEIDHCDPKESMRLHGLKDFKDLPHRRWVDRLIGPQGPMMDMARYYHPDRKGMFTCWNTRINARPANYGTRIDYVLASHGLQPRFVYADIQPEIIGSDHCPVYADFAIEPEQMRCAQPDTTSPLLTTNFPEFSSKQKKLSSYFFQSTHRLAPSSGLDDKKRKQVESSRIESRREISKKQKGLNAFFSTKNPVAPPVNTSQEDPWRDRAKDGVDDLPEVKDKQVAAWSALFQAPERPRCSGHDEPCLERTVTKKGKNLGRTFYVCSKPVGPHDGPKEHYSCHHFSWKHK